MDKKVEAYIDKIVSQLNCNEEEKREIADEMRDHLYLLKNEYIEKGFTQEGATQKALESFGEQKQLTKGLQESLFPFYNAFKIGTWLLFGLYSFIILFKLLFQRVIIRMTDYYINGEMMSRYTFSPGNSEGYLTFLKNNSNIVPFKNTFLYITGSDRFNVEIIINNTLGNILIFLPLGMFLPLLVKKYSRFTNVIVTSTVISFSIEVLQIALKVGQFDIDDVILNVVGSIVGFLLFKVLKSIVAFPNRSTFRRMIN
ncbi:VanZ family protein [Bacillus sp. FJAT-27245]|uniref:VanZ family protein n=1 Tax=Bacillus sp. FJAT-27245 TaxID=1684144 RepID=UPI0006A7E824|nr:VanZ family protein [Bacillus sp. FJAT-27245]